MAVKIYLYDNEFDCIGSGSLSADYIQYQLQAAAGEDIEVHISSCGGDAFAAIAIYNLLKQYKGKLTTFIDSVAASAAATIAMAGQTVVMSKYALLMIHKPITYSGGNADDLNGDIAMLNALQKNIVSIYMDKTGMAQDQIEALVNDTTWLTADEAETYGFIDEIQDYSIETPIVKNAALVSNYVKAAPTKYAQVINKILIKEPAPAPKTKTMTDEEKAEIVNPIKEMLTKVGNYLGLITNKVVTNKGEMFFAGNVSQGTRVFNSAAFDKAMEDGDVEVDDAIAKTVYSIAEGKVSNIVATNKKAANDTSLEDDEMDDDEMDCENVVVMNRLGVNMKKKAGNKAIKNGLALKLIDATNKLATSDGLVVELRNQLQLANAGLAKTKDEIKNEIMTEFVPNASNRGSRPGAVNTAVPEFAKPKEGSVAAKAAAHATASAK